MSDLLAALTPRFDAAIRAAFGDEHGGTDPVIRRSDRADFQADVALGLARKLKKSPREVAEAIKGKLDLSGLATDVEIAGPGFLNLTLDPAFLGRELAAAAGTARLGVALAKDTATFVIDYSAPNVAKEMHVGNMRSTIIGDALARVLEHLGHEVIRQNHLGDWGTPFGMLIEHLVELRGEASGEDLSISDLDAFYKQARAKFDGQEGFADRARQRVVLLQSGDAPTLNLWKRLVDESRRYFGEVYEKLGVTLKDADICGESFYNPVLPSIVTELEEKRIIRESEGALCAFPEGFTNKEGAPLPLIVRKKDGGYGYAATDLAGVRYRTGTLGATRLLYVIGAPQQQHLAMVFAVAKLAGWLGGGAVAEHVAFGSILGPDKKMFKTRSGDAVKLIELLDEARDRAAKVIAEKNPDLDEATRLEVARKIGIGAVKYADLSSDRVKDYVFDWTRMLAFEGNTAPYLQYAHARIRSILRKARGESPGRGDAIAIAAPAERALAIELLGFEAAVVSVATTLQPHRLCTYLYDVASRFTTFYESCPVLKADDAATRASRLALSDVTSKILAKGLDLLGIESPQAM